MTGDTEGLLLKDAFWKLMMMKIVVVVVTMIKIILMMVVIVMIITGCGDSGDSDDVIGSCDDIFCDNDTDDAVVMVTMFWIIL